MTALPGWTLETLHADHAQALREERVLYDSRTDHQRLRVFENPTFAMLSAGLLSPRTTMG